MSMSLLSGVLRAAPLVIALGCSSDDEAISSEPLDADAAAGARQQSSATRADDIKMPSAALPATAQAGRSARVPEMVADASAPAAQARANSADRKASEPEPESKPESSSAPDEDAGTEPLPSCAAFELPADCPEMSGPASPVSLHCAGLYADIERGIVACGLTEYTPAYELWSDGAVKRRWVSLPSAARVDTSNPDAFVFPVGTRFWKEFQVQLDGRLRRAETRLLRKVERGWVFTTYVWSADGRSALATNNGLNNWQGSGHTVPTRDQCVDCHGGRRDLVLGWDPVLLGPGARGVHFEDLSSDDDAGTPSLPTTPPGDAIEQAALGYLHVNCGVSCHNDSVDARARDTALYLRLATGRNDAVLDTPTVSTAINKLPTGNAPFFELPAPADGSFYDVLPGSSARSLLLARMLVRDHQAQMPPLASNVVDDVGAASVKAWIEQMTPERGYPAPEP